MIDKFLKTAGVNSMEDFYKLHPTEEHFFKTYPHMKEKMKKKIRRPKAAMGGYYQNGGAASQQGNQMQQLLQVVAQAFQQGASPEQIIKSLVKQGIPQDTAIQMLRMVVDQTENGGADEQSQPMNPEGMEEAAQQAYAKGGIHINPAKKGTFTAQATRMGMGVQEAARHILAHKDRYSPGMVKKANFARNAAKWKHEDGGYAMPAYGYGSAGVQPQGAQTNSQGYTVQRGVAVPVPSRAYGGYNMYQDGTGQEGVVVSNTQTAPAQQEARPSVYDLGMKSYSDMMQYGYWKDDEQLRTPEGLPNVCLDCINVDWTNPQNVADAAKLVNEGWSMGPHYPASKQAFNEAMQKFSIAPPTYNSTPNSGAPVNAQKKAYGGRMSRMYQEGGEAMPQEMMEAPQQQMQEQQGGQDQMMQQLAQMVAQALQQGMDPQQIVQMLVQQGVPQEVATQVVQMVMQQMGGGAPQGGPGQQYQPQGEQYQGPQPMAAMGGYYANGGINNAGFRALPPSVQQKIMDNMAHGGYFNESYMPFDY